MRIILLIIAGMIVLTACKGINLGNISDADLERISEKVIACEKPYMRHASSCCLDQNENKICDDDERGIVSENKENVDVAEPDTTVESEGEPITPPSPADIKTETDYNLK